MKKKIIIMSGILVLTGFVTGVITAIKALFKDKIALNKKNKRLDEYYKLLNQWLELRQLGITLDNYFLDNHYNRIAIYGMGELGIRLYHELEDSVLNIVCGIDKNIDNTYQELKVCYPKDCPKDIDAIVVTPIFAYEEIKGELSEYATCPIISLEDVVFGL